MLLASESVIPSRALRCAMWPEERAAATPSRRTSPAKRSSGYLVNTDRSTPPEGCKPRSHWRCRSDLGSEQNDALADELVARAGRRMLDGWERRTVQRVLVLGK